MHPGVDVALEIDSSFRVLGAGATLAIEVDGPTMADCLTRAVEGLASCYADVHPSVASACHPLDLACVPVDAADLLRAVLDASLTLANRGELAIGLDANGDHLVVEVVPIAAVQMVAPIPARLEWHDVALGASEQGWRGRAVALTQLA
jgi:hypothetical protein